MKQKNSKGLIAFAGLSLAALAAASLLAPKASAAAPGITGTSFSLVANDAYITQPDGQMIYSWGYGCLTEPSASGFLPDAMDAVATCPTMQIPGPTLIVTEGAVITVNLTNNLPPAAGNTSILFPGLEFDTAPTGGVPGLLTTEAVNSTTVTYTLKTAGKAGTHTYYSGTRGDLQVEMGLYGALIVLPSAPPSACTTGRGDPGNLPILPAQTDYRLAASAYNHAATCYDREYLFQFSEMDPVIHRQADLQKNKDCSLNAGCMVVRTENYHPAYYMINGRSMPDLMDPNYVAQFPHQPYNGNPHMHPGELTLLRIIGHGRWQHPFHEHGNHVRVLARDGNLILSPANSKLAGPLLFTTTTTPGQTMDAIFYWSGRGLNWDIYAHGYVGDTSVCIPDANGYYTSNTAAPNFYEWCADHNKPLEGNPAGLVGSGGPVTLPDPNGAAAGPWYGGSPYLGPDATGRASGSTPISPSGTISNDPGAEAGFAYMWHSHNEREITTNNIFPGGMLMMMLVDPYEFVIDESK